MTKHKIEVFVPIKKIDRQKITVELDTKEYVAEKLAQIRKSKNMNQLELSDFLGITRTSLSNIENGRQSLSIKYLELICNKLNVKSSEILPF